MKSLLLSDTPYRSIDSCGTRKNYVLKEVELYIHFSGIGGFCLTGATIVSECLVVRRVVLSCRLVLSIFFASTQYWQRIRLTTHFCFRQISFFLFLLYLVNCFNSLRFPIRYVKKLCWTTRPSFRYNESSDPPHRPRPKISRF